MLKITTTKIKNKLYYFVESSILSYYNTLAIFFDHIEKFFFVFFVFNNETNSFISSVFVFIYLIISNENKKTLTIMIQQTIFKKENVFFPAVHM